MKLNILKMSILAFSFLFLFSHCEHIAGPSFSEKNAVTPTNERQSFVADQKSDSEMQVSVLQLENKNEKEICSGVLYNDQFVRLDADCIDISHLSQYRVLLKSDETQSREIDSIESDNELKEENQPKEESQKKQIYLKLKFPFTMNNH